MDYLLLFAAVAAISVWLWIRNTRKLEKPRQRWEEFGKRSRRDRSNGKG